MYERFIERPLSHSQLASWEFNPAEWYLSYIKGVRTPPNPAMLAGSRIGDAIGTDANELPDLNPPGVKEYAMRATVDGITLVGYADHHCPETLVLNENKTSTNQYRWNQRKVDEHNQLTMYALLLQHQDKVNPADVAMYLNFIPVELKGVTLRPTGVVKTFETRRTQEQVSGYLDYLKRTIEAMETYAQWRLVEEARCASMKGTARLL